jgi:hypothetical protein
MARKRNALTHPKESEYDPRHGIQSLLVNFARCAPSRFCWDGYRRGQGLGVFEIRVCFFKRPRRRALCVRI